MSRPLPRRGFLRGLTTLPLIGGGVAILGNPSAVAGAPSTECVESYLAFLHYEFRAVHDTHFGGPTVRAQGEPRYLVPHLNPGAEFHFGPSFKGPGWGQVGHEAMARAPLVLAAVGCDWREGER